MSNRNHKIFGDINAENDDLLFSCRIEKPSAQLKKSIITGRWGSGKTAQMLLQNEYQKNLIKTIDPSKKMVWYLSERDIIKSNITELFEVYSTSIHRFESVLQGMWKAEIVRIYITLLNILKDRYSNTKGDHWKHIFKVYKGHNFFETASKHLADIASLVLNRNSDALQKLQENINELLDKKTFDNLKKCLMDIDDADEFIPEVVVEPIETPHSHFEDKRSLAASVVRALIEVYTSSFYPDAENPFKVRLVIPWHRLTNEISFPQKLTDSIGKVEWRKKELYAFICKRIEWEFNNKNRKKTNRYNRLGPWYELFDETIKNGWVKSNLEENSFDYFVRHTHYRTRDLINLCKVCVEELHDSKDNFDSLDDVIRNGFIDRNTIKTAFHKYNIRASEELINEAIRKYKNLETVIDSLYRLPLVFTHNEFKERLKAYSVQMTTDDTVITLWECGILGVTAIPNDDEMDSKFNVFSKEDGKKIMGDKIRWTWFFYNSERTPIDIMRLLEAYNCKDFGYVLHPKLYEAFTPIVSNTLDVPIGV